MPPPSTVSTVRASRLGVTASKSCSQGRLERGEEGKDGRGQGMCWRSLGRGDWVAGCRMRRRH
jgi:hypothetical protein